VESLKINSIEIEKEIIVYFKTYIAATINIDDRDIELIIHCEKTQGDRNSWVSSIETIDIYSEKEGTYLGSVDNIGIKVNNYEGEWSSEALCRDISKIVSDKLKNNKN